MKLTSRSELAGGMKTSDSGEYGVTARSEDVSLLRSIHISGTRVSRVLSRVSLDMLIGHILTDQREHEMP